MVRYLLFCLGLIGCLGIQNTAFSAPVGGAAASMAAPTHILKNVDEYHRHHHHHHHHYHHHDHP